MKHAEAMCFMLCYPSLIELSTACRITFCSRKNRCSGGRNGVSQCLRLEHSRVRSAILKSMFMPEFSETGGILTEKRSANYLKGKGLQMICIGGRDGHRAVLQNSTVQFSQMRKMNAGMGKMLRKETMLKNATPRAKQRCSGIPYGSSPRWCIRKP